MKDERKYAEKWVVAAKRADFKGIAERFGIDQVTARIIRNRDVIGDEEIRLFLRGEMKDLPAPQLMKDMGTLTDILLKKIRDGKKIRVIGDYDIDGVTSTYILYSGIKECGGLADTVIPHRIVDGYGLNERLIDEAFAAGVDTIITCDNGIAAFDAIAKGKSYGMTILVTDHHEIPFVWEGERKVCQKTEADAVVNPKQQDCPYPYKELCGAGVALRVVQALYEKAGRGAAKANRLIPYAAVGTVGDVVDLNGENRIIVKTGLEMLNRHPEPAWKALMDCCGIGENELTSYHIGFVLGPCINASGRLETAKIALKLLLCEDYQEAYEIAEQLKELNEQRKEMTEQYVEKAMEHLRQCGELKKVLLIYLPECHESIAGIIAGRVREAVHHPVLVATKTPEGIVKGSGRSIPAYSMYEELSKCGELFEKYGGHKMAAGFSLREENLGMLDEALNANCRLWQEDFVPRVDIDVPMPTGYLTEKLIGEFKLLEPFGKANARPLFAEKQVCVESALLIGRNRKFVKLRLRNSALTTVEAIYFGDYEAFIERLEARYGAGTWEELNKRKAHGIAVSIVYYPEINEYQGNRNIQVVIQNYRFD